MHNRFFKFLVNIYPPYLGAGIKVQKISPDFREIVVQMRLRWYNRNYVRTHFGGSLYAMVDPFYMLMLIQLLGKAYIVWDRSASIEFLKPGRGKVTAHFKVSARQTDEIVAKTENGQKFQPEFSVDIRDEDNALVAKVNKVLYIKRKAIHNGESTPL